MKVGVLGFGLMGAAMGGRLRREGHEVCAWNRSGIGPDRLEAPGINVCHSPSEVLNQADYTLLTLSDAAAIEQVLFAGDATPALAGGTLIQMGTIAPEESRILGQRIAAAGGEYLEAPVLGSLPEARNGTLIIMAGGDQALFQRCLPLLACLGKESARIGELGQGAALKLAMNQLIASLTAGFALSLGLVRAEGVDVDQFMGLLRQSALYAPTFDKKLAKYLDHDYVGANFPLKHLAKDVALFRRVAADAGIDQGVPGALTALCVRGVQMGMGDDDYSSLYEVVNPGRVG